MKEKLKRLLARIEARLIDDWKAAYKFGSARCATILVCLNLAHDNLDIVQGMVPASWMPTINVVLGAGVLYFRLTKQTSLAKKTDDHNE